MDYKKIYDFIKELDKSNIEENKPQLMRYVIGLMLSIKEEDETKSLEDLEDVFNMFLIFVDMAKLTATIITYRTKVCKGELKWQEIKILRLL